MSSRLPDLSEQFEVHEHTVLSSRMSPAPKVRHSHAGGDVPHQHPNTGPATYDIDGEAWFRSTGQRRRGKKTFTTKPKGEQLPIVELEEWQKSFEIVICDPMPGKGEPGYVGEGPGVLLPMRIHHTFKMPFRVIDGGLKGRTTHGS